LGRVTPVARLLFRVGVAPVDGMLKPPFLTRRLRRRRSRIFCSGHGGWPGTLAVRRSLRSCMTNLPAVRPRVRAHSIAWLMHDWLLNYLMAHHWLLYDVMLMNDLLGHLLLHEGLLQKRLLNDGLLEEGLGKYGLLHDGLRGEHWLADERGLVMDDLRVVHHLRVVASGQRGVMLPTAIR